MSSSTPNIGLTLPTGGENVSRLIINENNAKIDNYAGTLNSKMLKPITVTVDPITNGYGSYNHTTSGLTLITEDMKAIDIEVGTPETFKAPVTVTTGNHTVNVTCPSVSGSSTITITFVHTEPVDGGQNVPAQITSAEFDILAGRIGNLSSLQTSVKTDIVSAINVLNGKRIDTISDTTKTDMTLAFLNSVRSGMTDGQIAMVKVLNFSGIAYRYTADYMQILAFSYANLGTLTIYTYVTGTWRKRVADMGTATVIS